MQLVIDLTMQILQMHFVVIKLKVIKWWEMFLEIYWTICTTRQLLTAPALVPGVHLPLHLGQGEGRGGAALAEAGHEVLVLWIPPS